jgi:hypothetical protein
MEMLSRLLRDFERNRDFSPIVTAMSDSQGKLF